MDNSFVSSGTTSDDTNSAQSSTSSGQEQQIKESPRTIAEKRVSSDIERALWYVEHDLYNGSTVSYPYDTDNTEYSKLDSTQKQLYDEMLTNVQSMVPFEYTVEKYGYDFLDNVYIVFEALCIDHHECELYFNIDEVIDGDTLTALKSSYIFPSDS
ncbi:MAG: hypothetical protein ACI4JI_00440 [Ruminiclostridium sp.]